MNRRRPEYWPLDELHAECPSACAVWIALRDMARDRGSSIVTPTRKQLLRRTGIRRVATISAALTALENARWIDREHIPVTEGGRRTATLLRVVLRRDTGEHRRTARKTGVMGKGAVRSEKRSKGKARKTRPDFPKGKGASAAAPCPAGGTAADASGSAGPGVARSDPFDDGPMIPIAEALGLTGGGDG